MKTLAVWLALTTGAMAAVVDVDFDRLPMVPLQENAGTPNLFPMADCFGFNLEEATIDQMQDAMERGVLTSVNLVACYMTRTSQTEDYLK